MTTYACVRFGYVTQTFTPLPEWEHIPVADMFAPGLRAEWVPIDGLDPQPAYGWKYDGDKFTPPVWPDDAGPMIAALRALLG